MNFESFERQFDRNLENEEEGKKEENMVKAYRKRVVEKQPLRLVLVVIAEKAATVVVVAEAVVVVVLVAETVVVVVLVVVVI